MSVAGSVAVLAVALALVVAGAVIAHRRGGLTVIVRLWWGDRPPPKDQ